MLFTIGFFLAVVYHICHMDDRGLHSSNVFGISGPVWRTWDILFAQWLLGRTFGEVLGAQHTLTMGKLTICHTYVLHCSDRGRQRKEATLLLFEQNSTHPRFIRNMRAGVSNAIFPAAAVAIFSQQNVPTLGAFNKTLAAIMLATLASKLVTEGKQGWPELWNRGGARALGERI